MTDHAAGSPGTGTEGETEPRMRAVAAELTAAGLTAQVNQTRGELDVTATLERPGKPIEVIIDADGYVEITYWSPPDASPAQVVATISRALAMITRMS